MEEKPPLLPGNSSMRVGMEVESDGDDLDHGDISPLAKAAVQAAAASSGLVPGPSPEGKQKFSGHFRQLIIGMSSSTDEATQRKALESGRDPLLDDEDADDIVLCSQNLTFLFP